MARTTFDGGGTFNIGRAKYKGGYVNHLSGTIDDARTYTGALTDDQIRALAGG